MKMDALSEQDIADVRQWVEGQMLPPVRRPTPPLSTRRSLVLIARLLATLDDAHADGMTTIKTERLVNLTNALLHLAARRHEQSDGCDGCLNIQAVLKELIGLPEPVQP